MPLVVISEYEGFLLHPDLDDSLAGDLCSVAIVGKSDEHASWELTKRCGTRWSCYNGAIRLYWPHLQLTGDPLRHPVWTADRLLRGTADTGQAAARIRRVLRRQMLSVSALTIREPEHVRKIHAEQREAVRDVDDYEELLNGVEVERDDYKERLDEALGRIAELSDRVESLTLALRYTQTGTGDVPVDVAPDRETPPETVEDAVERAMDELSDDLIFGDDVPAGVATLARDAGPPEKVLRFLRELATMARTHRSGSLGMVIAAWLSARGCPTSIESETIRNSAREMERRTWDNGVAERKEFELHMKPAEATSPDRCVRIYFYYDTDQGKAIVGWVGRHPG